jgi:SAM-dependent methyltransferase
MNNLLHFNKRNSRHNGPLDLLRICWRQWWTEHALSRHQVHFRLAEPQACAAAYAAMTPDEFDAINGRQDWANWRTIPRALRGHVPDRLLRILDLGCGTGSSTRVLAWYAPGGSHITGYELAEPILAFARRRTYRQRHGHRVRVDFVCQGVTETWRQPDGSAVPAASVDVVNASGIVGHHLNVTTLPPLIDELRRVSVPDGIAMLDVGPSLPGPELRRLMEAAGFSYQGHYRSGWWDPTGEMVFGMG